MLSQLLMLYIVLAFGTGLGIGLLLGLRRRLEEELRKQLAKRDAELIQIRSDLAASASARVAAETSRLAAESNLVEQRELKRQVEADFASLRAALGAVQKNLSAAEASLNAQKESNSALISDRTAAVETAQRLQTLLSEAKAENSGLAAELKLSMERLAEERRQLLILQDKFQKEFEAISNKLLLTSSKTFTEQSSKGLDDILKPLKEDLADFKKKLATAHTDASTHAALLKDQITRIGTEAANLAKALKGEAKVLGDWGENMLDLILEKSGLQKDVHYRRQQGARDSDGKQRFLDVIVDLPDKTHLIIDSKVSLAHYHDHVNCTEDESRPAHLSNHIKCVRNHVQGLSEKRYQDLYGINAPGFVLMYIPIEPAFLAAVAHDPRLLFEALEKNVLLITNSSLMATLRTVRSLWQLDIQNKNHKAIAERGTLLYDKFCNFVGNLEEIGDALKKGQSAWDEAFKKLTLGKGSLVWQADELRKLGVKTKKTIPQHILDAADEEEAVELPLLAEPRISAAGS